MATLGDVFSRFLAKTAEQDRSILPPPDAGTRLRAFPNEDIYLFVKRIDNGRVVRPPEASQGRGWKQIGAMAGAVAVAVMVLMPGVYSTLAGYQIEQLRQEREKLTAQRAQLELEEAALLSPERMLELARQQEFIDPAPEQVVHLDQPGDQELAIITVPAALAPDSVK